MCSLQLALEKINFVPNKRRGVYMRLYGRSLFNHILQRDSIAICGLWLPLCFKEGRTHFGSMKSFNHASSVFFSRTSLRADETAFAKAGLALAGMYRRVGWFSWHTSSKVGRL